MAIETIEEALAISNAGGEIVFPIDWKARKDQRTLWRYLKYGGKRAVQVAHRRWGKDEVALRITHALAMKTPANYWHMLPQANQARKVVWDALNPRTGKRRIDECFPKWTRRKTREDDMKIELLNGSIWQLCGSDNYSSLVGSPPLGLVFSEWALANPLSWAYLSPILEENGGWALWIYTPRGHNHGETMFNRARGAEDWYSSVIDAEHSPVFNAEQLENIKQDYTQIYGQEMGESLFLQEYLCSFDTAVFGAYYAKQMSLARKEGRIGKVPHDPAVEVDTFWDLGVDDSMAIWFCQAVGKERRLIDYYESTGYGLEHYAKVMKEGDRAKYVYGNHFMPHDADAREMTAPGEIAKSRKQVAEDLGISPVIVVPRAKNMDIILQVHIPAVRNMLAFCWFDEGKCALGISALEGYAAEYDEEKKVLSNRPAHTWHSHGSDSMRTGALGYVPRASSKQSNQDWRKKQKGTWRTGG